ncbi:MAG: zinc ribbon domain-containing protein [Candidatus Coprovivens sp.]
MKKEIKEVNGDVLVHSKKNLIKCPNCGEENIKSMKHCLMCGTELAGSKSCPRCAKINKGDARQCENCGFKFTSKKKAVIASLGFSGILLIVLTLLLIFGKTSVVSNFTNVFRVLSVVIVVIILISTFTYGKKEVVDYAAKYNGYSQPLQTRKLIVTFVAILGVAIAGFIVYYFFFMNK